MGATVSDVPYGLLLSSGTDSMAILAMLKEHDLVEHLPNFYRGLRGTDFFGG